MSNFCVPTVVFFLGLILETGNNLGLFEKGLSLSKWQHFGLNQIKSICSQQNKCVCSSNDDFYLWLRYRYSKKMLVSRILSSSLNVFKSLLQGYENLGLIGKKLKGQLDLRSCAFISRTGWLNFEELMSMSQDTFQVRDFS